MKRDRDRVRALPLDIIPLPEDRATIRSTGLEHYSVYRPLWDELVARTEDRKALLLRAQLDRLGGKRLREALRYFNLKLTGGVWVVHLRLSHDGTMIWLTPKPTQEATPP